jgi:hypothetical protein
MDDASTDYSMWKATKSLERPTMNIPLVRKQDHTWARNNKEKAEVFAEHLARSFKPNEEKNMDTPRRIEDTQVKPKPAITPKEILNAIKIHTNPKKAPGFDLITGEILKQLPKKAIIKITYLYNTAFWLKYVPSYWKAAEVIMISKTEKPAAEVTSYTPISLLPKLSKLFEKLLLKRLKHILDEGHIIPTDQFGFRNNPTMIDQVHTQNN